MNQIPSLQFDTRKLPVGMGFGAFRSALPHYELSLPEGGTEASFTGRSSAWFLGDLVLLRSSFGSAFNLSRTAARIQADGIDTYNFIVLPRGSWSGRAEGRDFTVGPGQLVSVDLSRPFEAEAGICDAVHLVIGRAALDNAVRAEFDIAAHIFAGTGGALLTDYILSLARHIVNVGPEDVDAIRKATVAQVAAAISLVAPREKSTAAARNIRNAVQRYIDRHLTDARLTPEQIVEAVGVSRSSLYRHFEAHGGIAVYIQRRRLQAIHALLLHPDEERSIGELAQTFGFPRASHFTTAFRRAFGCTPRLLRSTSRRTYDVRSARDTVEAPAVFRDWIREIKLR